MAAKNWTGSKKAVDILNRLGHCASYSTFEELETKPTSEVTKEKRLTPNEMSLNTAINIGVAFDNFDRYFETISGKDTLHNTVDIAYKTLSKATEESVNFQAEGGQEVKFSMHVDKDSLAVTSDGSQNNKKRRKYVATGLGIHLYRKKLKTLFSGMIPQSDVIGNEESTLLFSAKVNHFLWIAQCSLSNNVPIWVG